jgi:uncharacterized membrane protein SpoIIM required for sporulation
MSGPGASSTLADREQFVARRRDRWERLEQLVVRGPQSPEEWSQLAATYRAVCADLASARSGGLPADVQAFLDDLAGRAHNRLYSVRESGLGLSILSDALHGFPLELRRHWLAFLLSSVLFYGPFVLGLTAAASDAEFAGRVLPVPMLEQLEEAYSGGLDRGFGQDATMAGFYVWNNVGIAFTVFATGVMFGLGSLYYLVYNGLLMGTMIGHLISAGVGGNLLIFVCGHAPWELTGICVAGASGLRMGWALIVTRGQSRLASLRMAGPSLYRLVLGTAVMLLVAAAIEGFWSAGPVPPAGKYVFAVVQCVIVAAWLTLGGRARAESST